MYRKLWFEVLLLFGCDMEVFKDRGKKYSHIDHTWDSPRAQFVSIAQKHSDAK
jgi:hypothetical protein